MSTKNLARTVIEGGRYGGNKWDRRNSSAEERVRVRAYCKRVLNDPEIAEEEDVEERQSVGKGFTDKLGPMYRWMDAQIGRPWSEVRSEVFQKFDTRTTAGRHITFDHLLREVVDSDSGYNKYGRIVDPAIPLESKDKTHRYYRSYNDYYVDQEGIFRKTSDHEIGSRWYRWPRRVTEREYIEAAAWLNGRMIMEDGGKLHWVTASEGIWKSAWLDPNKYYDGFSMQTLSYYLLDNGSHEEQHKFPSAYSSTGYVSMAIQTHGDFWNKIEQPFSFRQRGELNEEEAKYFKKLHVKLKRDILSFTKDR